MKSTKLPPLTRRDLQQRAAMLARQFAEWAPATREQGGFPEREFEALRRAQLMTAVLPGQPLAFGEGHTAGLLQLLKLIGQGNLSVGRILEGHMNALQLIHVFAGPTARQRWYRAARAGHLFGVWNTEAGNGVRFLEQPGGQWKIEGCKTFCSGSVAVTRPLITGELIAADGTSKGWQMAIVPLDRYEVPVDTSFWTPLGMENSVSYRLDFSGILLEAGDLLGKPDDYHRQPWFSGGAIRFAAVHLGGAEALLEETRQFLRSLGRTADAYQRTRLGQMAIMAETGNLWLERSGRMADTDDDTEKVITYANMVRTVIEEICTETLRLAERCVGARGLMHPQRIAALHTDLSMYLRQPAPDAALEQVGAYVGEKQTDVHDLWH